MLVSLCHGLVVLWSTGIRDVFMWYQYKYINVAESFFRRWQLLSWTRNMKPAGPQPCTEQPAIGRPFKTFVLRSRVFYRTVVTCSFFTTFTPPPPLQQQLLLTCSHLLVMTPLSASHCSCISQPINVCCCDAFSFSVSDFAVTIITVYMKFCLVQFVG